MSTLTEQTILPFCSFLSWNKTEIIFLSTVFISMFLKGDNKVVGFFVFVLVSLRLGHSKLLWKLWVRLAGVYCPRSGYTMTDVPATKADALLVGIVVPTSLSVRCGISQHALILLLAFGRIFDLNRCSPSISLFLSHSLSLSSCLIPSRFRWDQLLSCTAKGRDVAERERGHQYDYPLESIQNGEERKVPAELENEWLWPHQTCGSISAC